MNRKRLLARTAEALMGMDASAWARHANPWSGWTRLGTLPLAAAAIWSRVWWGWWALIPVALVLLWTWLNPRLFPETKAAQGWMSRGVLGEQLWLDADRQALPDHHVHMARLLCAATLLGTVLLGYGLTALDPGFTVAGLATAMLSKLWLVDRMVWLEQDVRSGRDT